MTDHPFDRKARLAVAVKRAELLDENEDEFELEPFDPRYELEDDDGTVLKDGIMDLCTIMDILDATLVDPPEKPPVVKYSTAKAPLPQWMSDHSLLPLKPPTKTR